jgi:hypothetical protein
MSCVAVLGFCALFTGRRGTAPVRCLSALYANFLATGSPAIVRSPNGRKRSLPAASFALKRGVRIHVLA